MRIKDRIRELRRVKASSLAPNPRNWRRHPKAQADALRGILAEVGIADAVLARERDDGVLELVDGHLRAETLGDEEVPVLVLDIDEKEAIKLLATLDPLASMAETDPEMLKELLAEIETSNKALQSMLQELSDEAGEKDDQKYTTTIQLPVYEVTGKRPTLQEMIDDEKTMRLMSEIEATEMPDDARKLLMAAAQRHMVFHFANIAEYYAHQPPEVQALMEKSAMVIIDFDKAIENGFVQITDKIASLIGGDEEDA